MNRSIEALPSDVLDTPAGKQLEWFLGQLAAGAVELDEAQILDTLSEGIPTRASPTYILGAWRRLASNIVPFEIVTAEVISPFDILIEIKAADGYAYVGHCLVEEIEPYRVRSFGIDLKPPPEFNVASLDEVDELLQHHRVPGMSVVLMSSGRVEWARCWGLASVDDSSPVTPETLFQAGSVSKLVTAVAALRMVDDGLLDLEEEVNTRLSSWQIPSNSGWQATVTVRDLLSHLGGITVWGFPGYPPDGQIPSLLQVLEGAPPANSPPIRVEAIPGLHWRYSGGGYCVLQQLMIDAMSKPFPELLRELVLDPLQMTSSTFEQPLPYRFADRAASGHEYRGHVVPGKWHVYPEMTAAGLWTTPSDLANLTAGIEAAKRQEPAPILTKAMVDEMVTGQPAEPSMGLGVFLVRGEKTRRLSHGGGNHGFVCNVSWLEDGSVGLIVMTNSSQGTPVLREMSRYFAEQSDRQELAGFNSFVTEAREAMNRATVYSEATSGRPPPEGLAGTFEVRPGLRVRVSSRNDHLLLEVPGQPEVPLYPAQPSGWIGRCVPLHVEFSFDDSARAGMTLTQYGRPIFAPRLT